MLTDNKYYHKSKVIDKVQLHTSNADFISIYDLRLKEKKICVSKLVTD